MDVVQQLLETVERDNAADPRPLIALIVDMSASMAVAGDQSGAIDLAAQLEGASDQLAQRDEPIPTQLAAYTRALSDQLSAVGLFLTTRHADQRADDQYGAVPVLADEIEDLLLRRKRALRPGAIAKELGRDRGQVSRAIGQLMHDGRLERTTPPSGANDKRSLWYQAVPAKPAKREQAAEPTPARSPRKRPPAAKTRRRERTTVPA
jgi:hypothetical protein